MGIVYAIENSISHKLYIGQTSRALEERWQDHLKSAAAGSLTPFHCAIRSYDPAIWLLTVLNEASNQTELDKLERAAIASFQTQNRKHGYNILAGGNDSPVHHAEVRAKISATLKGRKRSPESIAKQMASRKGFKHSEETKKRIAEANRRTKAKGASPETRVKISLAASNRSAESRKWSTTARSNHITVLLGHIVSEETRRKIGEKSSKKIMSLEARQRISTSMKQTRARNNWSTKRKEMGPENLAPLS